MARRKEPSIPDALLNQLLPGADPKTAFDPGGLLDGLKKAFGKRALNAEMDHHLAGGNGAGNGRNGYGRKTVTTDSGKSNLAVPRDRQFRDRTVWWVFKAERPKLVSYCGRFDGFHAAPASVSKACLVRFDNNRYSVAASAVGRPVEIRAYADRIERRQDGRVVGEHAR